MFVFDPLSQGLEFLAQRDLQKAESLFLRVINDPYVENEELKQAKSYLHDIRACQTGQKILDFDSYKNISGKTTVSLESLFQVLTEIYFSDASTYSDIDECVLSVLPKLANRLKQFKVRDIIERDDLFKRIDEAGKKRVLDEITLSASAEKFDDYRWKTIFRKFVEAINPILLERHLELLEYILDMGDISLLGDSKITVLTPKYRWILESTINSRWYLLRSYFFKAKSEVQGQFDKKEGNRKYWEDVKYKKIEIFEKSGFTEKDIQKFLFVDKLNYKTLVEIYKYALSLELTLIPRDVSLALRGIEKARDHIKLRAGVLVGKRKSFQEQLIQLGFEDKAAYVIAKQSKQSSGHQIIKTFDQAMTLVKDEIYWYRIIPDHQGLIESIKKQCVKHLSTVRIHLFDRGRLNKLLLKNMKPLIRQYLVRVYGPDVVDLHCYFRLETVHQYYKLKFFQYHHSRFPSVSELIKISREDFKPMLLNAWQVFLQKRRIAIPDELYRRMESFSSLTKWEDSHVTTEEKFMLRFWFLMDHGMTITPGLIKKGALEPGADLWEVIANQELDSCEI